VQAAVPVVGLAWGDAGDLGERGLPGVRAASKAANSVCQSVFMTLFIQNSTSILRKEISIFQQPKRDNQAYRA
jgi:hypothetical protein